MAGDSDRSCITMHCCGLTSEICLPLYVPCRCQYIYQEWTHGGLPGAHLRLRINGRKRRISRPGSRKAFCSPLSKTRPVILFFDGHSTRLYKHCLHKASFQGGGRLVHPASQHLAHPATTGHGSVWSYENSLERDSASAQAEDKGIQHGQEGLASLITELFEHSFTLAQLRASFWATGICPFIHSKAIPDHKAGYIIPLSIKNTQ